jgi:hypothetical protein
MKSFAAGAAASLGMVAILNARVLMFAAGYHRLPAELRDGKAAAVSVAAILADEGHHYL